MSIIEVHGLTFDYGQRPVLNKLTFSVQKGDFLAVLGPNGSGKTTLLHLLSGLLRPMYSGISIEQSTMSCFSQPELARKIALVRQDITSAFGFTVRDTVMMARYIVGGSKLFETRQDRDIVEQAMERTDTRQFAERPITTLSGGERQRVFIARALAQQTPILLLDEPTSHLDLKHQIEVFDLLRRLRNEEGKTIIVVSHDINLVQHYADCFLLLADDGRFCYQRRSGAGSGLNAKLIESFFGVRGVEGVIEGHKVFVPIGVAQTQTNQNPQCK